jgi:hypothetical protein
MAAGSTVAFCDGGSWSDAGTVPNTYYRNTNCRAASTCDWRNYPTAWGNGVKPKIQLASGHEFLAMGWYEDYSNAIHGFRLFNLDIRGQSVDGLATAENGVHLWGGVTDVDICNVEMHHGLSSAVYTVTSSTTARITLRDSYVHDNRGDNFCVVCGAADDFTVTNNVFDYNGEGNQFSHSIYFSQALNEPQCGNGTTAVAGYCPNHRIRLTNNVITRSAWGSAGMCMGVTVVAHDVFDDVLIEGNLISEPMGGPVDGGCYGIRWGNGGEAAQFTNIVVRNNRVFNVGGNGIAISGAQGVTIENNLIVGSAALTTGIVYPEEPYDSSTDLQSKNGTVRNNTVYLSAGGDGSYAVRGINEGTGYVFANNAIVTGPDATHCVQAPSGATVATNSCSTTGSGWWQNVGLDPAIANFQPAAGSPLVGAGTKANAPTTDLLGITRSNPPSVGAYEK